MRRRAEICTPFTKKCSAPEAPYDGYIEPTLPGKKVVLFGSYDWGIGEWLNNWEERCAEKGITLAADSVKCNNTPDDDGLTACRALGAAIA